MKLSIITINYNNKEGLKKTLDSVFNQTHKDFEYIVIDGGSIDGSKELLELNSKKINYWVSETDKGMYNAMNKGIKAAKGEYLLFLNSGDEFFENTTLEKTFSYLHTEDIITGNLNFISDKNNYIGYSQEQITFIHLYKDTIWHPCSFIKKEAFEKTELYDETLKICSDWKWFLLALFKHKLNYKKINITISKFFMDGISSSNENAGLITKERQETLKNEFGFQPQDFETINLLIKNSKEVIVLQDKISTLKKSRLLKLLNKLGIFKAYKYL